MLQKRALAAVVRHCRKPQFGVASLRPAVASLSQPQHVLPPFGVQGRWSSTSGDAVWNKKVCIVGGGNAAHVLMAMWPHMGFEVNVLAGFADEAKRINGGLKHGPITATFAEGNVFEGDIMGIPKKVSKDPADVVPDCDLLFCPLPTFAMIPVLTELKPFLREGHVIAVSPGQGGLDWVAHNILGPELCKKLTFMAVLPLPFNCRIEEYGRHVKCQVLKERYNISAMPLSRMDKCVQIASEILPKSTVEPLGATLAATLVPLNPIIHPARMYTLLTVHHKWEPGKTIPENPFFYEQMTELDTQNQLNINNELDDIIRAANANGIPANVPDCYNFLAKTYDGVTGSYPPIEKPTPADLCKLWHGPQYKTFRCPLKQKGDAWEPDFENRYFTEDIPCGLCTYKGVADIFGVKTPYTDELVYWAQKHMGKEYIVDGALKGKDVPETYSPQRWGITTIAGLKEAMGMV